MVLYSTEHLKDCYYSHVVVDTLGHGGRRIPCSEGNDHFFVEGDGRIFSCPLLATPSGNIRFTLPEDLLCSPETKSASLIAGRLDQCTWCLEPGCVRFSRCAEGFSFLSFLVSPRGRDRFRKAYYGEVLFKYF